MSRNEPSNTRDIAADVDPLFREDGAAPGTPMAYRDGVGRTQPVRGDDDAPYVKAPPFATAPSMWVGELPVPLANADYVATPELDCLQQRLLQIYFKLQVAGATSQLSLIAEGLAAGEWYVVGVVDLTVTTLSPVSARFPYGNFMSRTFSAAELRSEAFAGPGEVRWLLGFDVSPFDAFRLNVRAIAGAGGDLLTLRTAFAQ